MLKHCKALSSNYIIRQCIPDRDSSSKEVSLTFLCASISRTLYLARIETKSVCRSHFLNDDFVWKVNQVRKSRRNSYTICAPTQWSTYCVIFRMMMIKRFKLKKCKSLLIIQIRSPSRLHALRVKYIFNHKNMFHQTG